MAIRPFFKLQIPRRGRHSGARGAIAIMCYRWAFFLYGAAPQESGSFAIRATPHFFLRFLRGENND
jgi:hypothetical protein